MRRNTELGAVRLRTVLGLVILGVAGYVGAKVSAPYFANSQLKDKMREEARFFPHFVFQLRIGEVGGRDLCPDVTSHSENHQPQDRSQPNGSKLCVAPHQVPSSRSLKVTTAIFADHN